MSEETNISPPRPHVAGSDGLLPCPFCSGEAEYRDADDHQGHYIACSICEASSTAFHAAKDDVRQDVIEAWNSRGATAGEKLIARIETLKSALKPFAEAVQRIDTGAVDAGFDPGVNEYVVSFRFSLSQMRAAREAFEFSVSVEKGDSNNGI